MFYLFQNDAERSRVPPDIPSVPLLRPCAIRKLNFDEFASYMVAHDTTRIPKSHTLHWQCDLEPHFPVNIHDSCGAASWNGLSHGHPSTASRVQSSWRCSHRFTASNGAQPSLTVRVQVFLLQAYDVPESYSKGNISPY